MMKKGKCIAVLLLTAVIAMAPVNAYGIETTGEYFEISSEEAGAFLYDGTTVMAGTDGEMILTKSESGWVRRATIRTTDMNVITAEIPGKDHHFFREIQNNHLHKKITAFAPAILGSYS